MNGLYGVTGKMTDAHHGRKWTRAMENWAKPHTRHTPRTRTLTRTRERANGVTEKNGRRPSWTAVDACHGILGGTTYKEHPTYTDPYTDP